MSNINQKLGTSELAVCGALTGVVTKTMSSPFDRLLLLYQTQGMLVKNSNHVGLKYNGIMKSFTTILKEESFTGLFKGNFANIIRASAVYSIKFGTNDYLKNMFRNKDGTIPLKNVIMSAAMAGAIQKISTFPLDMISLRIAMGVNTKSMSNEGAYKGIGDCVSRIYRTEGVGGFYKGLGLTVASGVPYVVMQLTMFEYVQKAMQTLTSTSFFDTPRNTFPVFFHFFTSSSAGALTALISKSIMFPLDTIRKRIMLDGLDGTKSIYNNSSWQVFKSICKNEGWRSLFAGLKPSAVKAVIAGGVQFGSYETFKRIVLLLREKFDGRTLKNENVKQTLFIEKKI